MLIQYYKHIYQCEKIIRGGHEFYKGKRLFKNDKLGKSFKIFLPEFFGKYYNVISK